MTAKHWAPSMHEHGLAQVQASMTVDASLLAYMMCYDGAGEKLATIFFMP